MTTVATDIFAALQAPDTSGNVWPEPASISQTNKLFPGIVWRFKDTATKISLGFRFIVPSDYTGGGAIGLVWTSTATSGGVVWVVDYVSASKTSTLDPAAAEESVSGTSTAPGTSQLGVNPEINLTGANLAAGDVVEGSISRDGTSGSDTMAADAVLYGFYFKYTA